MLKESFVWVKSHRPIPKCAICFFTPSDVRRFWKKFLSRAERGADNWITSQPLETRPAILESHDQVIPYGKLT